LHLNNFSSRRIDVQRVEIWSAEKLMTLEGESLAAAMYGSPTTIEGGKRAILMLWLKTETACRVVSQDRGTICRISRRHGDHRRPGGGRGPTDSTRPTP